MKNKRMGVIALSMLAIGAIGSIATQTFAQSAPPQAPVVSTSSSAQADQAIDQKDASGNDLETQDDTTSTVTATGSAVESEKADTNETGTADTETNDGPDTGTEVAD